jgi:hypothetical protein
VRVNQLWENSKIVEKNAPPNLLLHKLYDCGEEWIRCRGGPVEREERWGLLLACKLQLETGGIYPLAEPLSKALGLKLAVD